MAAQATAPPFNALSAVRASSAQAAITSMPRYVTIRASSSTLRSGLSDHAMASPVQTVKSANAPRTSIVPRPRLTTGNTPARAPAAINHQIAMPTSPRTIVS